MQQAMQSTPSYASVLDAIPQASRYLIIVQDAMSESIQILRQSYEKIEQVNYLFAKNQVVDAALVTDITKRLAETHIGLHAVVCGDEIFLWQVRQLLVAQGLINTEIQLIKTPSDYKHVYCVHCFQLFSTTATEFCDCPQCASYLLIRSHFSERLGAYMGVCANAEELKGETT